MGLRGKPGGHAHRMWILRLHGGHHAPLDDPPEQRSVRLVGEEELTEAVRLREQGLCSTSLDRTVGLPYGELCITDQLRKECADDIAMIRGSVPRPPGMREACLQVGGGRSLLCAGERIRIDRSLYPREPRVAGTGEQRNRPGLIPGQLCEVMHPQRFGDPQHHRQLGHLQLPALHLLDPTGRLAHQPRKDRTAHASPGTKYLHALTERDGLWSGTVDSFGGLS